jgi:outer membrane immunogenic protein
MKKVMLGGVALITLGFVGAAAAADMPVKAPPPVVVNTWTGYYIGGDIGGLGGSHDNMSFSQSAGPGVGGGTTYDPTNLNGNSHWGLIGGVFAGYNWAVTPSWVVGVEGDWNKTNLGVTNINPALTSGGVIVPTPCTLAGGGAVVPTCNGVMMSDSLSWIATVRGRLGYTWGSMMLYGTGGWAGASQEQSGQVVPACSFGAGCTVPAGALFPNLYGRTGSIATSVNTLANGWAAGAGLELMATANWLLRIEYLHYQFGTGTTHSVACGQCVAGAFSGPGNFTWGSSSYDSVRAGLAYKF